MNAFSGSDEVVVSLPSEIIAIFLSYLDAHVYKKAGWLRFPVLKNYHGIFVDVTKKGH